MFKELIISFISLLILQKSISSTDCVEFRDSIELSQFRE